MASFDYYINESGFIYGFVYYATTNVTGSLFLTLLFILLGLMAMAFAFRVPIEFTIIFLLPLVITLMAFNANFLALGGILLVWLGIILAKNFFFGR